LTSFIDTRLPNDSMPGPFKSVVITGMGIVSSIGANLEEFHIALRTGRCGITELDPNKSGRRFAAKLQHFDFNSWLDHLGTLAPALLKKARKVLANTTDSTRWTACSAIQAVLNAGLEDLEPNGRSCGIIVAGSNLAQNYIAMNWQTFSASGKFNPRYGISFWDTNQVGCISEILSIHGPGITLGAGAASGNAAIFQALHWLRSGLVERCIVVGAGVEFSELELESLATLGAAFSRTDPVPPDKTCRPFDRSHSGFVFGEGSAAVVLEFLAPDSPVHVAEVSGAFLTLDGNHLPEPSLAGEVRAMQGALTESSIAPDQIGYLNAHGTGTPLGDRTECSAINTVFQKHVANFPINSTKSLTGHCLSASGVIELVASVLQLNNGFAHPNPNLENPIDLQLHFVGAEPEPLAAEYALSNGFGFGGINCSIVVKRRSPDAGRN
jgi:malonyl-[acp] decarboxylase